MRVTGQGRGGRRGGWGRDTWRLAAPRPPISHGATHTRTPPRPRAAVWWLYLLAYGAFPLSLAQDLYYLFVGIVARGAQYWLFLLMTPLACMLPDFFWRNTRK